MKPQLAHKADNYTGVRLLTDNNWGAEAKYDGERRLIEVEGELLRLYNRKGDSSTVAPLSDDLAAWFEPFEGEWAFDGELMPDGRFVVFDLLKANGVVTPASPLIERSAALAALHERFFSKGDLIVLSPLAQSTEDKTALARSISENRGEGLMLKRLTGTYVEGRRSREVLKWKFWKTADLICGTVGREGKDSVQLLALDKETSELVDVGSAATQGKGKLQRGDVIEVRYLYFTGSRLYQTNILRRRSDKDAAACWLDQLETTNKFAFETT